MVLLITLIQASHWVKNIVAASSSTSDVYASFGSPQETTQSKADHVFRVVPSHPQQGNL